MLDRDRGSLARTALPGGDEPQRGVGRPHLRADMGRSGRARRRGLRLLDRGRLSPQPRRAETLAPARAPAALVVGCFVMAATSARAEVLDRGTPAVGQRVTMREDPGWARSRRYVLTHSGMGRAVT